MGTYNNNVEAAMIS